MAWVRHGTLTADTVATVTVPDRSFSSIEVMNRDGASEIYFLLNRPNESADPTVGGDDCDVLPGATSTLEIDAPDPGPIAVKLISHGTPKYSVRAE